MITLEDIQYIAIYQLSCGFLINISLNTHIYLYICYYLINNYLFIGVIYDRKKKRIKSTE